MSVRIRATRGTSWRGASPGTRHYRSTSVSFGLGTYLAWCSARGLFGLFLLPFALMWWCLMVELWVCAFLLVFIGTGVAVITKVCRREGRAADITVRVLRWHLLAFGLKGVRQ